MRMKNKIEYAEICFKGLVRENNEDNFWCDGQYLSCVNNGTDSVFTGHTDTVNFATFAVFDGMGGESCGEMAAYLAAEKFDQIQREWISVKEADSESFIRDLCQNLNDSIFSYAQKNGISSMGSTAAMLFFQNKSVYAANIGDSRIYRFCDHKLMQISKDHVFQSALYRHPSLTQFLGISKEEMVLSPHIQKLNYNIGDIFLLCSDGLTKMFTDEELEKIMDGNNSAEETVSYLHKETLKRGAWDNTTILLCRVKD